MNLFGDVSNNLTVNFTVGGTATLNSDYTPIGATSFTFTSGSATFAAGAATATVTLDPLADGLNKPNETAILTLISGAGYSATAVAELIQSSR